MGLPKVPLDSHYDLSAIYDPMLWGWPAVRSVYQLAGREGIGEERELLLKLGPTAGQGIDDLTLVLAVEVDVLGEAQIRPPNGVVHRADQFVEKAVLRFPDRVHDPIDALP